MLMVCLQKLNLRVILKRDNLTFLRKIATQDFICFQNTRLICPLFCEFLCGIMFEAAVRRLYA